LLLLAQLAMLPLTRFCCSGPEEAKLASLVGLTSSVRVPSVAPHLDKGTPGKSRGRKATGPQFPPRHYA